MSWSRVDNQEEFEKALKLCKGKYQRNFLFGSENLSGSSIRGKARKWAGRYKVSRFNLLDRLDLNGIPWHVEKGINGRYILVIGSFPFDCNSCNSYIKPRKKSKKKKNTLKDNCQLCLDI